MTTSVGNSERPHSESTASNDKTSAKPFILIIHGAYCTPGLWQPFVESLVAAGYDADCPRLPTCGDRGGVTEGVDPGPAVATYEDDVKVIRQRALELARAKHSIVALPHSYGGLVAAEAINAELYAHSRAPRTGGVTQLILLNTWLPLKGNSMLDCLELHGYKSDCEPGINENGTSIMKNAAYAFFNDVKPSSRADELAATKVTHI